MTYRFALLDPRPIPAAETANAAVFSLGPVLGVEVTVAALAARCSLGNLDPQHAGQDASTAAIEEALVAALPPADAVLVTVRADCDAVGAMAVLCLRAEGATLGEEILARIGRVAAADKSDRGPWQPRPLPTAEMPWPAEAREYAALSAAIADFKVPVEARVAAMRAWLEAGEIPARYLGVVDAERAESARALATGEIAIRTVADGRVAVVESGHRAALGLGYCLAPVVVARNPSFKLGAGEPHVKYTCAQHGPGYADIRAAGHELAGLEAGWGGSPTIVGSPQGVSSQLTLEQVTDVIVRHLKRCHCTDGPRPCVPAGEKSPVCAWCHASLA